jgi:hypothetical protein
MSTNPSHPFADIVPTVRADAMAYVVLERRDVEAMSRFLHDFGFTRIEHEGPNAYFRGFGEQPYSVELIPSDRDAFVGFGLVAAHGADIDTLGSANGIAPADSEKPGGGRVLQLVDPNGYKIDLVHGFEKAEAYVPREVIDVDNTPWKKSRVNAGVRPPLTPAPVEGVRHLVLQTPFFEQTVRWYMQNFGYLPSDLLQTQSGMIGLGFLRFDRGEEPADHHALAISFGPAPAILHISTETIDIDAIGQGQQYLRAQGWEHFWGIGRHVLGSQVFDYWKDPAGDEWEHYADGDVMTADYPVGFHRFDRAGLWAWGDDLPSSMRPAGPAPEHAPPPVKELIDAMLVAPRPWLD